MIIPLLFISAILLGIPFIRYTVNNEMTRKRCKEYGKGSFDDFLREFNKLTWERNPCYPKSFFHANFHQNMIHAGIRKFDGKGMTMNFWDNIRYELFLIKNKFKGKCETVKW